MIVDGWVNLPQLTHEMLETRPELRRVSEFFGGDESLLEPRPPEQLFEAMDEAGVDRGLLAVGLEREIGNRLGLVVPTVDDGLDVCDASEGRIRLTVSVASTRDVVGTCRTLRALSSDPRVATCLIGAASLEVFLTDRRLYPVYETCCEVGLPVFCNIGVFGPPMPSKYQHPLLLEEVLSDFPELILVGAHMGHPWERLVVRLMMKFPNFHLMTSAYHPKYLDPAVVRFMSGTRGERRVIWGSDWPMLSMTEALAAARALPLPASALDGYLGRNLVSLLDWA